MFARRINISQVQKKQGFFIYFAVQGKLDESFGWILNLLIKNNGLKEIHCNYGACVPWCINTL